MDSYRKNKILRYYDRIEKDVPPVSIQAGITDVCYNKCHMCTHHKRKDKSYIPGREWIDFLNSLEDGLESVCYSGGDMMTHPDLNEIMDYHIETDIAFGFITAGFIPDNVYFNLLSKARWMRTSLDTINPEIYKKARGGFLEVSDVLDSVDIAIRSGVNVELTITASEITKPGLKDLFEYAIKRRLNADIHPVYGSSFEEIGALGIIREGKEAMADEGLTLAPYLFGKHRFERCAAPWYQIFVDSKGHIYPCCTAAGDTKDGPICTPLGNIRDIQSFYSTRYQFWLNKTMIPGVCDVCVNRFGEINSCVEDHKKNSLNSFF